jgi:hypothetical protein
MEPIMKYFAILSLILFLSACDFQKIKSCLEKPEEIVVKEKSCLDKIEDIGNEEQKCLVNQVLKSDCDFIEKKRRIIQLECEKDGDSSTKKQRKAAYELGTLKAKGDKDKSVYRQVMDSFSGFPASVKKLVLKNLVNENFLIFTDECKKQNMPIYWKRYTNRYKDGKTILIFYKLQGSCFDVSGLFNSEDLNHSFGFSILTEVQVESLKSNKVSVLKFENWEKANFEAKKYK